MRPFVIDLCNSLEAGRGWHVSASFLINGNVCIDFETEQVVAPVRERRYLLKAVFINGVDISLGKEELEKLQNALSEAMIIIQGLAIRQMELEGNDD